MAHGDGNENESLTTAHARPLLTHYHSSRAAKGPPTIALNLVVARAGARGRDRPRPISLTKVNS
jgi:hypothetical protein